MSGRTAATAIEEWLSDHTDDLPAAPTDHEQAWLTHVTASLARVAFLQACALHQELPAFTQAFTTQVRSAFGALLADEPDLAAAAPILRAVAEPDGLPDLVHAAASAAFAAIRREAARHDTHGQREQPQLQRLRLLRGQLVGGP
jgi:hypothetical protein